MKKIKKYIGMIGLAVTLSCSGAPQMAATNAMAATNINVTSNYTKMEYSRTRTISKSSYNAFKISYGTSCTTEQWNNNATVYTVTEQKISKKKSGSSTKYYKKTVKTTYIMASFIAKMRTSITETMPNRAIAFAGGNIANDQENGMKGVGYYFLNQLNEISGREFSLYQNHCTEGAVVASYYALIDSGLLGSDASEKAKELLPMVDTATDARNWAIANNKFHKYQNGQFGGYIPKIGDLIVYRVAVSSTYKNEACHTEIVTGVNMAEKTITTFNYNLNQQIEGSITRYLDNSLNPKRRKIMGVIDVDYLQYLE